MPLHTQELGNPKPRLGQRPTKGPQLMVPAVSPGEVWRQSTTMSPCPPRERTTVMGSGGPQREKALQSQKEGSLSLSLCL